MLSVSLAAEPEAPIVEGQSRAIYLDGDEDRIPAYRNESFQQDWVGEQLEVRTRAAGGWTRTPFRPPPHAEVLDPVAQLARDAVRGSRLQADAVAQILHAVASEVRYTVGPGLAELPEDVLLRREANCVGLSNLAVALLGAVGISARVSRGLLYEQARGSEVKSAVPHRWVEVWYTDAGWVFSDPTESINYVSARHVLVDLPSDPDQRYDPAVAKQAAPVLLREEDAILAVDLRPGRRSPLGERRTVSAQYRSTIRGRSVPRSPGHVRLEGPGGAYETAVGPAGEFAFPGLVPGRYRLAALFGSIETIITLPLVQGELRQVEVQRP